MLRITADVNGRAIGFIYIHNIGQHECKTPNCGLWKYDAAYWNPAKPLDSIFGIEGVYHRRESGWMPLANQVLRLLTKE